MNVKQQSMSGLQKIAILLMALDEENAKRVISFFDDEEIEKISETMLELGYIEPSVVERVVIDFMQQVNSFTGIMGNTKAAKKVLAESLGEEKASELINTVRKRKNNSLWTKFDKMAVHDIAGILMKEHPQTVAAILSQVAPMKAAEILLFFNKDYAIEIIRRMMTLGKIQSNKIAQLENILSEEIGYRNDNPSGIGSSEYANYKLIADIFDNFSNQEDEELIKLLTEYAPEEADNIKKMMFSFSDLSLLTAEGLQLILLNVEKSTLSLALKGAAENILDSFMNSISPRAARLLMEDIARVSGSPNEIKQAQFKIISTTKKLIRDGKIHFEKNK